MRQCSPSRRISLVVSIFHLSELSEGESKYPCARSTSVHTCTRTASKTYCTCSIVEFVHVGDFLNELSNDGAKQQFEKYVTQDILPVMVHCAQVRLPANVALLIVALNTGHHNNAAL